MDLKDTTLIAFTLCSSLRLIAYLPQIISSAQDWSGCAGMSCATWAMFLMANSSTAAYALVNLVDTSMAILFAVNGVCCAAILAIVGYKRLRHVAFTGRQRDRGPPPMFDGHNPPITA